MIFLQGFIKLDKGIYEKCVGQPFDGRKKERKKERKNNNNNNEVWLCLDANTKVPKRPSYQNLGMWMQVSSLPTNSSLQNTPRYQFALKSETIDKIATIANQNGRHMVQHVLFPVNIHFHWNFSFLNLIFFNIGGHSENFKNSTTLSDNLFLCQVSKGSAVWSEFNIVCTLVTIATAAILNLYNPSKAATHHGGYFYKVSWDLMKGIIKKSLIPLFLFPWQLWQSLSNRFRYFWLISSH